MGVGAGPILQAQLRSAHAGDDPEYWDYALDGYGFREGYIYRSRRIVRMEELNHPDESARRAFDRGIARSIWFLYAADADKVVDAIARFAEGRRDAMWRGLGFVCGYTGACDAGAAKKLVEAAGGHRGALAGGAAAAALARDFGDNMNPQSELAHSVLTGARSI